MSKRDIYYLQMNQDLEDVFLPADERLVAPITWNFRPSTKEKYQRICDLAPDKRKAIAKIRMAAELMIEDLFNECSRKMPEAG